MPGNGGREADDERSPEDANSGVDVHVDIARSGSIARLSATFARGWGAQLRVVRLNKPIALLQHYVQVEFVEEYIAGEIPVSDWDTPYDYGDDLFNVRMPCSQDRSPIDHFFLILWAHHPHPGDGRGRFFGGRGGLVLGTLLCFVSILFFPTMFLVWFLIQAAFSGNVVAAAATLCLLSLREGVFLVNCQTVSTDADVKKKGMGEETNIEWLSRVSYWMLSIEFSSCARRPSGRPSRIAICGGVFFFFFCFRTFRFGGGNINISIEYISCVVKSLWILMLVPTGADNRRVRVYVRLPRGRRPRLVL